MIQPLKFFFGSSGCEQLKDLLNSILYPSEKEEKIKRVKYLINEFHQFNQKKNKGALRTDIASEIEIKNCKYLIIIEMQKEDKGSLNQRLFDYGTSLRNVNNFKNCISLGISCSSKIPSNNVKLEKTSNRQISTLDCIQTIEINVDNELLNIENDKEIYISGKKIYDDGKEFLKLFALKKWALNIRNRYVFQILKILIFLKIKLLMNVLKYYLLSMINN